MRAIAARSAAVSTCSWEKSVSCIAGEFDFRGDYARCAREETTSNRAQNAGDGLDLVAGVFRQAGADRTAGIERRLTHQHLRRHQIAQHRHIFVVALLVEHAGLDRERHEGGDDGLAGVVGSAWNTREEFSELHDLIDVENILLEHAARPAYRAWSIPAIRADRDRRARAPTIRSGNRYGRRPSWRCRATCSPA